MVLIFSKSKHLYKGTSPFDITEHGVLISNKGHSAIFSCPTVSFYRYISGKCGLEDCPGFSFIFFACRRDCIFVVKKEGNIVFVMDTGGV